MFLLYWNVSLFITKLQSVPRDFAVFPVAHNRVSHTEGNHEMSRKSESSASIGSTEILSRLVLRVKL